MTLTVLESDAVIDAAIARLLADAGVGGAATLTGNRIYRDVYQSNDGPAAFPIITVSLMAAPALMQQNAEHVMSNVTILVKVTDRGTDYRNVHAIAKRVVTMLDGYGDVTKDGVYIERYRLIETPPQPADFGQDRKRYMYWNSLWYTEAQPA